jgi:hypothetical protein
MIIKFLKRYWQKIVLSVFLILIAIVLVLGYFFNEHWSPILADKFHATILKNTDSLYNADFSSAEFHLFQGKIVIFNITLKPDTIVYNRRKKQGLAPNNLLEIHLNRLVINHVHPFKLYFKHVLDIEQIILSAPEVHISYQLNHTKDTTSKDNRTAWQKISKSLHSIHVRDILLNDVQFRYDDYSGNKVAISELKEMNVHVNDLLIDSLTQNDRSRFLYCKDVMVELNNYTGKTPSGLYTYTVKYLKLSTLTSQLNAEGITLEPIKTGLFFYKTKQDRYSIYIESLQLNRFDFLNYHKYRAFRVSSLSIDQGTFSLFTNPNKTPTAIDKITSFPSMVLANLKEDSEIDTLNIKHLNISYSELNNKSKETGTITFNHTNGQFLNITNNKAALLKNNICTVRISSYFMAHGELNTLFRFNLTDKDAAYSYKGNLGPMDLKLINPAVMPLGMVKINSGKLKKLDFDFKANRKIANGRVTILYNDLKVTVLKADTNNEKLKRNTIASLYANVFIIKHDNPDNDGEAPRSFNVSFPRPISSPFFNFTWKSLLTGIKPGVGFDQKKQEVTSALVAQGSINKQNRIAKREQRKQRRAERKKRKEEKKLLKSLPNDGSVN